MAGWTFPEMRGVWSLHIPMDEPRSRDTPVFTLVVSVNYKAAVWRQQGKKQALEGGFTFLGVWLESFQGAAPHV